MPLSYNKELKTTLERRFHENLLDGYFGGIFNPTRDKFYALTWVNLSSVDYDVYRWHHEQLSGYSAMYHDYEKKKKQVDSNSWQSKTPQECVDEGIYQYFAVSFIGIFFEAEWFIIPNLDFYGAELTEPELKVFVEERITTDTIWESNMFAPETMHRLNDHEQMDLSPTSLEFKEQPWMVSMIKQQKKERVNHAYSRYINEEFLESFFKKLRIYDPDNYLEVGQLRYGYTIIFPEHKKYILFCAQVKNNNNKWHLRYFLFDSQFRSFYKWTYFDAAPYDFSFFYGDLIINDLKQISHWDSESYLDSSCTLDDENFWSGYVFKLNDTSGHFLYLEEMNAG
jgi:hypothetical protein